MGVTVRHMRRAAPVVASGTVVITLVACLIIAKANNIYTGGLTWPYFSDLGRDSPGYYVFCVGLAIAAMSLCATWYFNYKCSALRVPTLLGHVSPFVGWAAKASSVIGVISTIGLPMLICFLQHHSLHNNAAYWLFFLETLAIFLNTFVSYWLFKSATVPEATAGEIPVICDVADIDAESKFY
ncbi:Frag1/DRAM/Sfk1 family, partial [Phytophthora infestans]